MTLAKICGITDEDAMVAAVEHGASYVGLVFFPPSPRAIEPVEAADLLEGMPEDVTVVGLFVNPTDADLDAALNHVRLDMIQLHGSESPERVEEIRLEYATPVIKALGIAQESDLDHARRYADAADMLLFDAKPPADADRPGGHGLPFAWDILRAWDRDDVPWMLAGGLTPENVGRAIAESGAKIVDVSSGVEREKGRKDPARIKAFLEAVERS
jgi:phosphoribosylanthranilate isomerase